MSILIKKENSVLIQGITGREGNARTRFMLECGMNIPAGVTPGRKGMNIWGVPVYNTIYEAMEKHGQIDASVAFVPGPQVKTAVFEAINAGIKFIVIPVERVPLHDSLEMISFARKKGTRLLGPGSLGLITAEKAVMGWLGGSQELAEKIFKPGPVGVMSRSGGQTTTVSYALMKMGLGISTALHIGSEPVVGLTFAELLPLFEADKETLVVVIFAEPGTKAENEAAEIMKKGEFTKPLVVHVAGKNLPSSAKSYSHASNRIEGAEGTAENKIKTLKQAGAYVVEYQDIAKTVKKILKEKR